MPHCCRVRRTSGTRCLASGWLLCRRTRLRQCAAAASAEAQTSQAADASFGNHQAAPSRRFTAGSPVSKSTLSKLRVAELRERLQEEGLSTAGLKAELVERLYAAAVQGELAWPGTPQSHQQDHPLCCFFVH